MLLAGTQTAWAEAPRVLALDELASISASGMPPTLHPDPSEGRIRNVVVADGSTATLESSQQVALSDDVQAGLRGANVINAAAADSASAANIFDGSSAITALDTSLFVRQLNDLSQVTSLTSSVGHMALGGMETEFHSSVGSAWKSSARFGTRSVMDRELTRSVTGERFRAIVDTETPDYLVFTANPNPIDIADFELTIIGALRDGGEDVLAVALRDGSLMLGDVTMMETVINIAPSSLTLPRFEVEVFGEELPFIPDIQLNIPIPELDLDVIANPLVGLNYGVGMAAYGEGSISTNPGYLRLALDIGLDDLFRAVGTSLKIPGTNINSPWTNFLDQLPSFRMAVETPFDPLAPLQAELGGTQPVCIGDVQLCELTLTTIEYSESDSTATMSSVAALTTGQTTDERHEFSSRGQVELEVAQADKVVVGGSSLDASEYSLVILDSHAQVNARMLAATNAANALVGNGLNVSRGQRQRVSGTQLQQLHQSNSFVQIGGL